MVSGDGVGAMCAYLLFFGAGPSSLLESRRRLCDRFDLRWRRDEEELLDEDEEEESEDESEESDDDEEEEELLDEWRLFFLPLPLEALGALGSVDLAPLEELLCERCFFERFLERREEELLELSLSLSLLEELSLELSLLELSWRFFFSFFFFLLPSLPLLPLLVLEAASSSAFTGVVEPDEPLGLRPRLPLTFFSTALGVVPAAAAAQASSSSPA